MCFPSLPKLPRPQRKLSHPQKRQRWSQYLMFLFLLILLPPAARAEIEHNSPTFYDDYADGSEVATFTGLEPHANYEFVEIGGGYIAQATSNSCGMMQVKVPKKYPMASLPYGGHNSGIWNTGSLFNGTTFFWRNLPDWDNVIVGSTGADMTLADNKINCAYIVGRFSWFAKLKDNVLTFYAADRDIPKNATFFVRLNGGGPEPWKFSQRRKSNACGHVSFKYLWTATAFTKRPGYKVGYQDRFELRKGNALVQNYSWNDSYKWTPRPICSKGRSFTTNDPIQYQN